MTAVGYQQYLDVASARDVPTFQRRLQCFSEALGFPLVNATLVVEHQGHSPSIAAVRNTPSGFEAVESGPGAMQRDPVLMRLKTSSAPFVYDQSMYVDHGAGDLWEEQAPFGYRTGISMALHLNGGRHFLLGVDRADPLPQDSGLLVRLMADLQLLAVFAQETALRLLLPHMLPTEAPPQLTVREVEILKWVLVGKSSSVIGQLLNISLSTVNFHLRSAMDKLGVATKHQAAARAHALGLI